MDVLSVVFAVWLAGVVVCDFARRRAPNRWLSAGVVGAIVALCWRTSPMSVGWQDALTGGVSAFIVLLGFYMLGMMGAGDVKFAGVLGLWLGTAPLLPIATGAGLLAGCHALFLLARRYGSVLLGRRSHATEKSNAAPAIAVHASGTTGPTMDGAIPYAGYLALMALLWLVSGAGATPL